MKKFLLWRDLLVGIAVAVGLPLLVRHKRGLLIFACLFVGLVLLPRVFASAWGLIVGSTMPVVGISMPF